MSRVSRVSRVSREVRAMRVRAVRIVRVIRATLLRATQQRIGVIKVIKGHGVIGLIRVVREMSRIRAFLFVILPCFTFPWGQTKLLQSPLLRL